MNGFSCAPVSTDHSAVLFLKKTHIVARSSKPARLPLKSQALKYYIVICTAIVHTLNATE